MTLVSRGVCPEGLGSDAPSSGSGSIAARGPAGAIGGIVDGAYGNASDGGYGYADGAAAGRALAGGAHGSASGYCEREGLVLATCLVAMSISTLLCGLAFLL